MNKFNMFIITSVLTAGTMILLGMTVGNVTIQHASAQLPDKDNESSTYVPGQNRSSIAGGWMPMERPGWDPNDAPENNPGQSGQESGINGCLSSNCTSKIQNKNWPLNSALPESSKHSLSYLSPSDFSSRMILE